MECTSCHVANRNGLMFCASCGAAFDEACAGCGARSHAGARFCSHCGHRLSAAQPHLTLVPPAGEAASPWAHNSRSIERRQMTVMFYDLADSTVIASQLDPEDVREVIADFHRCVSDQVQSFGGFVANFMGDGAVVYFGYPHAHENDPERAVSAGLAAVEAVSRLTLLNGYRPRLRIGIATGLVVVGDIVGIAAGPKQDIAGGTPHLAARLQGIADPGAIAICATTRRLSAGSFKYADRGELPLSGFAKPQRVWQVVCRIEIDSRFEAQQDGRLTKLIGRQREIAVLLRGWRQARAGVGQVVLLSGEAGIGKSRIAGELLDRLSGAPHARLRYFCSQHQEGAPLAPFIVQLERAANLRREDTPAHKWEKLQAALIEDGDGDAAALFADLLSIRRPEIPSVLTAQQRRERTLRALIAQLERLCRRAPVVALFEDAHWIDPTSAELLNRMVERVADLPVMLIVTSRPEFAPAWAERGHVKLLTIEPLSRNQALSIVDDISAEGLQPDVRDEIVARADGIPLFLEELTKAILETRDLTPARDVLADDGADSDIAVPTTLQTSLMARLDRLGSAKAVAQIGAAIGREFSFELLAAVADISETELAAALVKLVDTGLVYRRGGAANVEFLFKHALVHDVAYSTLLRSTRRRLHARIVESLEELFPEATASQPGMLARHCTAAGLLWKGAAYWLRAGQQALQRSAMKEAAAQLQEGLEVLAQTPSGSARNRQELEFVVALGKVLIATKGHAAPITGETFARARQLCELLEQPSHLVSVLHGQWTHALLRAELSSARSRAEELLRLGEARGEASWQVMGHRCCGVTSFPLGELETACDHLERGLALFDPGLRSECNQWTVDDVNVVLLYYSAWALLYRGQIDLAQRRCKAALAEARQLAQPYTLAHALIASTLVRIVLRDFVGARVSLAEVLALAEEHDISYFKVVGSLFHGRCLVDAGRSREAVEILTKSLSFYRASSSVLYLPTFITYLAEAYAGCGQTKQALAQLDEAAEIVERTETRCDEADLCCVRGELLAAIGDRVGAERNFGKALNVARRQSARLSELRAATGLAQFWGETRPGHARDLLLSVYDRFTEGFNTAPLQSARAILSRIDRSVSAGEPLRRAVGRQGGEIG